MLQRVISYNDGRVVFYYNDKEVTYRKNMEPEIINKVYNKKGIHGLMERTTDISSSGYSFSGY